MSIISHWLNRTLTVWRPTETSDGQGGATVTFQSMGSLQAKVDQPSAAEQWQAGQEGARHTHNVYLEPTADVQRNDELRGDGQTFRVYAVVEPSTPRYRKALCEMIGEGN